MDCTECSSKVCRKNIDCLKHDLDRDVIKARYLEPQNQPLVQSAAALVDNGRAGTLGRIDELIEFSREMNYQKVGLAYCYAIEKEATRLSDYFARANINLIPISCTVTSLPQDEINQKSDIHNVSCNPIAQAEQINRENVDITITMGLCLGHDILFNRTIKGDITTLVVKDRLYNHQPLKALE